MEVRRKGLITVFFYTLTWSARLGIELSSYFLVTKGATEDIGVTPRAAHCRELAPLTP